MRKLFSKIVNIKIDGFPLKEKKNLHGIISFVSGTLLIISESLPFLNTQSNGILHCISEIQKEYKTDFK